MKRANYFSGLWVDSDLLNFDSQARQQTLKDMVVGLINADNISAGSGSIIGRPGDTSLLVAVAGAGQVSVAAGGAIDKDGNWIYVPENVTVVDDTDFEPAKPSRTVTLSDLGVTATGTYYFGVGYSEDSGCVKSNRDGESFYTRYYDSYTWYASSSVLPSPYITLASFYVDTGTGLITNLVDRRTNQWISCQVNAANVYIADPPITEMVTVEDHINMVQDSSQVSATNPHGVSLSRDFASVINPPTGLVAGEQHGTDAHDDTVMVGRIGSEVDTTLLPVADGGGTVWVDGYVAYGNTDEFAIDTNIDWRKRFITIKGFLKYSNDALNYLPGGSSAGQAAGYLSTSTTTPQNLALAHGYTASGSLSGAALPYLELLTPVGVGATKLRVYAKATSGYLYGKVAEFGTAADYLAFGMAIDYSPVRDTVS
jgi:hypothetical protein